MEKYNIKEIEIGATKLIEALDTMSIRVTVSNHAKRFNKKFSCKKVQTGVEVTRLS